jgi:hypothetical protein
MEVHEKKGEVILLDLSTALIFVFFSFSLTFLEVGIKLKDLVYARAINPSLSYIPSLWI